MQCFLVLLVGLLVSCLACGTDLIAAFPAGTLRLPVPTVCITMQRTQLRKVAWGFVYSPAALQVGGSGQVH